MASYKIDASKVLAGGRKATLLRIGFADAAQNDVIVRDAASRLAELVERGTLDESTNEPASASWTPMFGSLVLLNGPASLPVAAVLTHQLAHKFGALGVFDPKLSAYVVAVCHGGEFSLGDLIPAGDVVEAA